MTRTPTDTPGENLPPPDRVDPTAIARHPTDLFVTGLNGAGRPAEAVDRMKALYGGSVPRLAVMARAVALRKGGTAMKELKTDVAALH